MTMFSDNVIDITIDEVTKIINTAGRGLARENREASQALMGCSRALMKKRAEIKANVLELYER